MPYPNEHAARLRNPGDFAKQPKWRDGKPGQFRRTSGGKLRGGRVIVPRTIGIIWGKLKGKGKRKDPPIAQALRFPIKDWTEARARAWLKRNKITPILFEPATKKKESALAALLGPDIAALAERFTEQGSGK